LAGDCSSFVILQYQSVYLVTLVAMPVQIVREIFPNDSYRVQRILYVDPCLIIGFKILTHTEPTSAS